jgi:hypothetical protein
MMKKPARASGPVAPKRPKASARSATIAVKATSVVPDTKPVKVNKTPQDKPRPKEAEKRVDVPLPQDAHAQPVTLAADSKITRERVSISIPRLKAAVLIAAKKDTRKYLCGVHVKVVGRHLHIVATDGHQMIQALMTSDKPWPDVFTTGLTLEREALASALAFLAKDAKGSGSDQIVLEYATGATQCWLASRTQGARFSVPVIDQPYPEYERALQSAAVSIMGGESEPLSADSGIKPEYMKAAGTVAAALEAKAIQVFAPNGSIGSSWVMCYAGAPAVLHIIMPVQTVPIDRRTLPMLGITNLKGTMAALKATITMKERAVEEAAVGPAKQRHQDVLNAVKARLAAIEDAIKDSAPKLAGPKPEKKGKKAKQAAPTVEDSEPKGELQDRDAPPAPVPPKAVH